MSAMKHVYTMMQELIEITTQSDELLQRIADIEDEFAVLGADVRRDAFLAVVRDMKNAA